MGDIGMVTKSLCQQETKNLPYNFRCRVQCASCYIWETDEVQLNLLVSIPLPGQRYKTKVAVLGVNLYGVVTRIEKKKYDWVHFQIESRDFTPLVIKTRIVLFLRHWELVCPT